MAERVENSGTMDGDGDGADARLLAEAARVRDALGAKRSDRLVRLFDFLLDRTIAGRPPAEAQIAEAVFATGRGDEHAQDAPVRVYVHRLRKALETIHDGVPGPRIVIPKGEYVLVLTDAADTGATPGDAPAPGGPPWRLLGIALALILAANLVIWWSLRPDRRGDAAAAIAATALWKPLAASPRPLTIVLGDYYLFAEDAGGRARLVRDPEINAREDLDIYLMANPARRSAVADRDHHYVSSGTVRAVGQLDATLTMLRGDGAGRPRVIPASALTPELLKTSDIVYVGQLSGLGGLLRNPLFHASGFRVGATWDELIDAASGRRFTSDGGVLSAEERIARRDFGYVGRLPGPSGNHIVIVAGARDPALLQMSELVTDPLRLAPLDGQIDPATPGFEALFQVRTMDNLNLADTLLVARPLRAQGVWDQSGPSQRFPNDAFEGEGRPER